MQRSYNAKHRSQEADVQTSVNMGAQGDGSGVAQRLLNEYNMQNLKQVHHKHLQTRQVQDPPATDPPN